MSADWTPPAEAVEAAVALNLAQNGVDIDEAAGDDELFDRLRGEIRELLTAAAPHMLADAWDQGKNAGLADAPKIVGWGITGGHPEDEPTLSTNPYRTTGGADR